MKKILVIIPVLSIAVLTAFTTVNNSISKQNPADEIIGKTGVITFPEFSVEETFVSSTELHWKIVDEKGNVIEENEKISYKKINDHQFFVNWIEKTGLTVSQVLDVKNGTATAFVSRADEKSERGQRSANFFQGTFKLKK